MTPPAGPPLLARGAARVEVAVLRAVTAVVDGSGPVIRFGAGHAVRRRLLQRRLVSVAARAGTRSVEAASTGPATPGRRVVLVTRTLGTGGVEAIVSTLARGLSEHGLGILVLCERGGATADALRTDGVTVVEVADREGAEAVLAQAGAFEVAQLHNAPDHLVAACEASGIPLVPVVHTTDINLSAADWRAQGALFGRSDSVIAVSETVRAFVEHHLPVSSPAPIVVVPNGVAPRRPGDRVVARRELGAVLGVELGESAVVVCLARYDMQKNIPGLVAAFLAAAADRDARLVVAGPVEDWLEYAHADAIRRAHPLAGRVHLLGSSSPEELLDAADVFVLDSFFEGWPVAASEAVMAGIPLVISEVGGAIELVGTAGSRGVICANPGGAPAAITLAEIRSARRRRRQRNQPAVASAFATVYDDLAGWRGRREELAVAAAAWLGADAMVAAHARLLSAVGPGRVGMSAGGAS